MCVYNWHMITTGKQNMRSYTLVRSKFEEDIKTQSGLIASQIVTNGERAADALAIGESPTKCGSTNHFSSHV
jgi:hypothetical protein